MKIMRKPIQFICMASMVILLAGSVASCSCSSGNNKKSKPTSYVEAVSMNDYVTAHEMLDNLLQRAITANSSFQYEYIEDFFNAADHVYKSEMMYLIEMNDPSANKRLINTLAMMNVIGDKPLVNQDYSRYTREYSYYVFIMRYNRLCDEVLNISFLNNNREMARQVLLMYKEDAVPRKKIGSNGVDYYSFTFSNKSKEVSTKKYNDAIKNGLLD